MKYSAVLLFAIGAFAIPQDASVTSAPKTPAAIPTGLSPAISCAMSCDDSDVTCKAACLGNARPNASQVIDTNECVAKCDQGDGSTEDSNAYAKCRDSCINSLFPSSQTAFGAGGAANAVASGSAGSAASAAASATGSANPTATSGGSASASGSESGSAAEPAATGAADKTSARLAGAGLAGLLAIFAL